MAECDLWIHLDTVQYTPRDWENRNKIKTPQGWTWLTVPVKARHRALIPEVRINYEHPWQYKHGETIKTCYGNAPFFDQYIRQLQRFYESGPWEYLRDLNIESTGVLCDLLGIRRPGIMRSSELNAGGKGSELILNLCREVGATVYLSGTEGRNYLDREAYREAGIQLRIQEYRHPEYPQQFGAFEPYMAAIDLMFNCGPESLAILRRDQQIQDA